MANRHPRAPHRPAAGTKGVPMATDKTYTYAEVTAKAEERICWLLDSAEVGKELRLDYALGVYFGWMHLTAGDHTVADAERLDPLRRWKAMRAAAE